jgi:hypothetical protein
MKLNDKLADRSKKSSDWEPSSADCSQLMSNEVNLSLQRHLQRETDDIHAQREKDENEVGKLGRLVSSY